jgi:molecular chaperone GrpE
MPNSPVSEPAGADEAQQAAEPPIDRLAELQEEHAKLDDRFRRALADLDNYRKRSARETERRVAEAREDAVREWLEAVDSVERALRMEPDGAAADGLRAVLEQMDTILERQGVTRVGRVGEPFDPNRHDAVAVRHSPDVPDGTIADVARSGFAVGDRVLRPAQVVVARKPPHEG